MTDEPVHRIETDEEKLERIAREYEQRDASVVLGTAPADDIVRTSRTSVRALFFIGIVATIAGASIWHYKLSVDTILDGIRSIGTHTAQVYEAQTPQERLLSATEEVVDAYQSHSMNLASTSPQGIAMREHIVCIASVRDAFARTSAEQDAGMDAGMFAQQHPQCAPFLTRIPEYSSLTQVSVLHAGVASLVALERGVLADILVATWESSSFAQTHADLASFMAMATFITEAEEGDTADTFARAHELVSLSTQTGMYDLAHALPNTAAPYRYVALVHDRESAGAYNMPARVYLLSTREGDATVERFPLISFEYSSEGAVPVLYSQYSTSPDEVDAVGEVWNGYVSETGTLLVGGMKPAGWWPCNPQIEFAFHADARAWIEVSRELPTACADVSFEEAFADETFANGEFTQTTYTFTRPDMIAQAKKLAETLNK